MNGAQIYARKSFSERTKKVLFVIIDALSSRVVNTALQENRLPNFQKVQEAASLRTDSIAVFPSITPAATSTLITGRYPRDHGVSGAYWYESDKKRVVYFGYDVWAVLEEGVERYAHDFLVNLNEQHLHAPTLFQATEQVGLTAASLNFLIYHGLYAHDLELPGPFNRVRGAVAALVLDSPDQARVNGPSIQYFGDVIHSPLPDGETLSAPGGPMHRFGIEDSATAELLRQIVDKDALPDFTVAYFPDNDFQSHKVGPDAAVDTLQAVDDELGDVFEHFGGLDRMLDEVCLVITGDHSQSNVLDKSRDPGIRLEELLDAYSIAAPGTPLDDNNDLVICPNLRSAQFYFHTPTVNRIKRTADSLLQDERVDQVLWYQEGQADEPEGFQVITRDRGALRFWRGSDGRDHAEDRYGNEWSWEGDLETVSGQLEDGHITFDTYPDAFERVAGVLDLPIAGQLWATSQPGYEFQLDNTGIHAGGGSHGSLHALDSLSPLWVAGWEGPLPVQEPARSMDVAAICSTVLGIEQPC
jgi:hypothetical protein